MSLRIEVPGRRSSDASIIPMINVAFLLLVFLLLSAVLVPPDPVDVTPPSARTMKGAEIGEVLIIDAQGTLYLGALSGASALAALPPEEITIRADAAVSARRLAEVLRQVEARGIDRVQLITTPPDG